MQARFGARSGTAPLLLGLLKIALGLLFGSSLYQLLKEFPPPLLGALLIISGSELAAMVSKQTGKRQWYALGISDAEERGHMHNSVKICVLRVFKCRPAQEQVHVLR